MRKMRKSSDAKTKRDKIVYEVARYLRNTDPQYVGSIRIEEACTELGILDEADSWKWRRFVEHIQRTHMNICIDLNPNYEISIKDYPV